jgi:hypothetical protein
MDCQGEWQFETQGNNIKALFYDQDGCLRGYALSGTQSEHRQRCLAMLNLAPEKSLV